MKRIVRNRADAKLLPSRHDFAIFRVIAWMRLSRAKPASTSTMHFADRHQSAAEMWTVGIWMLVASTLYATDALSFRLPLALAGIAGFAIALTALQLAVVVSGLVVAPLWRSLVRHDTLPLRVNSIVVMSLFIAATAWASLRPGWVRYAGWMTLAAGALNLMAAILLRLFRNQIARLEASVLGGAPSER